MSVLSLLMTLALGPAALGEEPMLTLRWEAPPECPDRGALVAMIDATLGEVSNEERHAVDVRARVETSNADGFVLRLELDGGEGVRELRGASCRELSEAAALLIAIAIDPRALDRQPEDSTRAVPEPASTEPAGDESASDDTPVDDTPVDDTLVDDAPVVDTPNVDTPVVPREPLRFLGRAEAGVGGGPLPGAAAVLGVAAGLGGRGWRAELSAVYWTPRSRASPNNPAIGVRAQLWALGVHGCGEPRWRSLSFPLCAAVLAGAVHARGEGQLEAQTVSSRWVALALEPGLVWWARPRLGVALRGEGHVTLARPELRAEPSGTVFVGAPGGGSVRGGLEIRLP